MADGKNNLGWGKNETNMLARLFSGQGIRKPPQARKRHDSDPTSTLRASAQVAFC
jgi:hypothetical protein